MVGVSWDSVFDVFVGLSFVSFSISTATMFVQSCHISLHPLFIGSCKWQSVILRSIMFYVSATVMSVIIPILMICVTSQQIFRNAQFRRIRQTKRTHLARPSTT